MNDSEDYQDQYQYQKPPKSSGRRKPNLDSARTEPMDTGRSSKKVRFDNRQYQDQDESRPDVRMSRKPM